MDFYLKRGLACPVLVQEGETDAVKIAAGSLRSDLEKVFGRADETEKRRDSAAEAEGGRADGAGSRSVPAILAGTLGVSADFDALTEPERIAACGLYGENGKLRKEGYLMYVREGRLIIAGTDRRGTIYGIYELSGMLGVSPWYFWGGRAGAGEREEFFLPEDFEKADWPACGVPRHFSSTMRRSWTAG